jgi:hypothetical protein
VPSLRISSSTTTASDGGALEKVDGGCHGEMCVHREEGSGLDTVNRLAAAKLEEKSKLRFDGTRIG